MSSEVHDIQVLLGIWKCDQEAYVELQSTCDMQGNHAVRH